MWKTSLLLLLPCVLAVIAAKIPSSTARPSLSGYSDPNREAREGCITGLKLDSEKYDWNLWDSQIFSKCNDQHPTPTTTETPDSSSSDYSDPNREARDKCITTIKLDSEKYDWNLWDGQILSKCNDQHPTPTTTETPDSSSSDYSDPNRELREKCIMQLERDNEKYDWNLWNSQILSKCIDQFPSPTTTETEETETPTSLPSEYSDLDKLEQSEKCFEQLKLDNQKFDWNIHVDWLILVCKDQFFQTIATETPDSSSRDSSYLREECFNHLKIYNQKYGWDIQDDWLLSVCTDKFPTITSETLISLSSSDEVTIKEDQERSTLDADHAEKYNWGLSGDLLRKLKQAVLEYSPTSETTTDTPTIPSAKGNGTSPAKSYFFFFFV